MRGMSDEEQSGVGSEEQSGVGSEEQSGVGSEGQSGVGGEEHSGVGGEEQTQYAWRGDRRHCPLHRDAEADCDGWAKTVMDGE